MKEKLADSIGEFYKTKRVTGDKILQWCNEARHMENCIRILSAYCPEREMRLVHNALKEVGMNGKDLEKYFNEDLSEPVQQRSQDFERTVPTGKEIARNLIGMGIQKIMARK